MKLLPETGVLCLLCLVNASTKALVQDTPAATTIFHGVNSQAEIPQDWEGWESSNGQVYFMDLTHANPMGFMRGHVRMAITSADQVTPDMIRDGFIASSTQLMEQNGCRVVLRTTTT